MARMASWDGMAPRYWRSTGDRWRGTELRVRVLRFALSLLLGLSLVATFGTADVLAQASGPAPPAPAATPAPTPPPAKPPADAKPATPVPVLLPNDISESVERLLKAIKDAEAAVDHYHQQEDELQGLRTKVEVILSETQDVHGRLQPLIDDVKAQIEHMGPLPAAGQPAEAAGTTGDRDRLNGLSAQLSGALKSIDLTWLRARQLIEKITVMRHALFTRNLMERLPSPLLPALWQRVFKEAPTVGRRLAYLSDDWWGNAVPQVPALTGLILAVLALFVILRMAMRRLIAWGVRDTAESTAAQAMSERGATGFFERAVTVAWITPARILPGAVAAMALYTGLEHLNLLFAPWDRLGAALLKATLAYVASAALIDAAMSPKHAQWRAVPFSDRSARRIDRLLKAMVAVYAIDYALTEMSRAFFIPLALSLVQAFVLSLLFALLLMGLATTPFELVRTPRAPAPVGGSGTPFLPTALPQPMGRTEPYWLKWPMWVVAIGIIVSMLIGYISLGRFVAHQVVLTGLVIAVGGLCTLAIRALTRPRRDGRYAVSDPLEQRFGIDAPRQRQLARLTELVLTSSLLMVTGPALLLQWGFASADIQDWFKSVVFGFDIGHFHISVARILIGVLLFMGLLFLTRVMQQWLREGLLAPTRMDTGIANSIDQAFGYAGITIAALVAVSYAGFDVTSLAIVAGALSVGIGFGLQSIVNNFVSGLILLVERPIKVGDWVVVGDLQGNVRRISVRSTEIETFDKASLILPNSELISGRVVNWTHRNLLGRIVIKFTLDGNADPEAVIKIMLASAATHSQVMAAPAPSAYLDQFAPAALDFSLHATINDITRGQHVLTDLRVAILRELRRAGQITAAAAVPPGLVAVGPTLVAPRAG